MVLSRAGGQTTSLPAELRRWPLLAAVLPLLPLLVLLLAALPPRQRQWISLDQLEQPQLTRPFQLRSGWLGSPEIRLRAELPANSAMALAVELLDADGTVLLALDQEGWRETGVWAEEGESGTYDESDTELRLQLRPQRPGELRLRLRLEDLSDAAGRPLPPPLRLQLEVHNHSVDGPLLWITALVTAVLVRLYWVAVYGDCRQRQRQRCEDDRLALRLPVAGPGLLRVQVRARYEEPHNPTAPVPPGPLAVVLRLHLSDGWGRMLAQLEHPLRLQRQGNSDDSWWGVNHGQVFRLPESGALRAWAQLPDRLAEGALELEWIELLVEDGVVTAWPVPVTPLA